MIKDTAVVFLDDDDDTYEYIGSLPISNGLKWGEPRCWVKA